MGRLHVVESRLSKQFAFSEEDFKSWPKAKQRKWLQEHPDSMFGRSLTETPDKPAKLSKEERQKIAQQKWEENLKTKSKEDQKAFIAARKAGVAIPPVWVDVTFNEKPIEGVIASGTDAKGRKQRLEDPEYRAGKIKEKHQRIQERLEPVFDGIVKHLRKQATSSPEAQVLYLITQTGFRIGGEGDGKAREKAYGASTLLGKHVSVDGDTVTFDFIGKEGVHQHHVIKDATIAKFCANKDPEQKLFNTNDAKVRKAWKDLGGDKVHDIRSLLATRLAKKKLKSLIPPPPKDDKELNAMMKKCGEIASKTLGNRPSEALNTYIDQSIFPSVGS